MTTPDRPMPDEIWVSSGKYQLLIYKRPVDPLTGKTAYPRFKYTLSSRHTELLERVKRMEEALRFYADADYGPYGDTCPHINKDGVCIERDTGQRAREALKGKTDE